MGNIMSRRISFCVLAAAVALIATQASADPRHQAGKSGARSASMHGFHGGAKRMHAHDRRSRAFSRWSGYALPYGESGYPVSAGMPVADFGNGRDQYRCEYYDCVFSYHPFGYYDPRPNGSGPVYGIAPNAKIISIDSNVTHTTLK